MYHILLLRTGKMPSHLAKIKQEPNLQSHHVHRNKKTPILLIWTCHCGLGSLAQALMTANHLNLNISSYSPKQA
jgi:hypothetical protein